MAIQTEVIEWRGGSAEGIVIELPRTTLLILSTSKGYLMCGALDIPILDALHPEREIVAARAVGVRNLSQLLDAPIKDCTRAAQALGVFSGMAGRDALVLMA